ncbi:MAG: BrnT family toxin [Brachymonas sp.]|nr:BrnT family toxin [Brachymonas sp.]
MFEWDEAKAASNLQKHAVSFEEAATVFEDALSVCFPDPEHSDAEDRLILVGYSVQERLLFVSHRELSQNIRIISARLATPFERKRHEEHIRF